MVKSFASFITDMGQEHEMTNTLTGEKSKMARYGVWKHAGRKHQVVDTGNDLETLKKKHNIKDVKSL